MPCELQQLLSQLLPLKPTMHAFLPRNMSVTVERDS